RGRCGDCPESAATDCRRDREHQQDARESSHEPEIEGCPQECSGSMGQPRHAYYFGRPDGCQESFSSEEKSEPCFKRRDFSRPTASRTSAGAHGKLHAPPIDSLASPQSYESNLRIPKYATTSSRRIERGRQRTKDPRGALGVTASMFRNLVALQVEARSGRG